MLKILLGFVVVLLLLVVFMYDGCHSPGQRMVNMKVQNNGNEILSCSYAVSDYRGLVYIFKAVEGNPLSKEGVGPLYPNNTLDIAEFEGNKLRQYKTLTERIETGDIKIVISHTSRELGTISLKALKLVQKHDDSDKWYLAPGEIERLEPLLQPQDNFPKEDS